MNTKQFVENLIKNNKERKKQETSKQFKKMNMYMAAEILSLVIGVGALTYAFPVGLAVLGCSVAALSGYIKEKKKKKIIEEAIDKEIAHLSEINEKGIKVDNTSKRERHSRYMTSKSETESKEKHINNCNLRDKIVCSLSAASGVVGFIFGGLLGVISPIIAAYKVLTDNASKKDYEDYMNDKVEYNNVMNEYKILNHAANTRSNTRTTPTRVFPKRGKAKQYSKEQIEKADKYIEALSKMESNNVHNKKMVKK